MIETERTNLKAVLKNYMSDERFARSISGSESAWRGFERQTLYICSRLIESESDGLVFWPETVEDLLIENSSADMPTVELVQVKAKTEPLQLNDIASKNKGASRGVVDGLFGHIAFFLDKGINVTAKVIVFGELGAELDGFTNSVPKHRKNVIQKIKKMYGDHVGVFCETNLLFERVNAVDLERRIKSAIESYFEVSAIPELLKIALMAVVREKSLNRGCLALSDVRNIARRTAGDIAAQSGLNSQYGKTIFPLSERFKPSTNPPSREEYKLGVNAQPEHIAMGYDVPRPDWIDAIDDAFLDSDTIIVQGASGQGKSTLCLRYLYDRVPIYCSYTIDGAINQNDANDIAAGVMGIVQNSDEPLYVYIDGASGESWIKTVQLIRQKANRKIRFLVSIREEDANQLSFSEKDLPHTVIRPTLSCNEAEQIYALYENPAFPSFDESWRSFGGGGPLMEYTASLGIGSTLESMLQAQIESLIHEGHDDAWLYALFLASVLGSESISVFPELLREASKCGSMSSFMERTKNEHLLRIDENGAIGPLHPYRSKLIANILKRKIPYNNNRLAVDVVKCASVGLGTLLVRLTEDDLGNLPKIDLLIKAAKPSWLKLSEVIKYALWCDTRKLFFETAALRKRMQSKHVASSLIFMIAGGVANHHAASSADALLNLVDEKHRADMKHLIDEAGFYKVDYKESRLGLNAIDLSSLTKPLTLEDLQAASFLLAQFAAIGATGENITNRANALISEFDCDSFPLEDSLDYITSAQLCGAALQETLSEHMENLVAERHSVIWYRYDGEQIEMLQVPNGESPDLNDCLVDALVSYRKLHPHARQYCGKQLGLDAFLPSDYASMFEKHIPAENLPIFYLTLANRLFLAMCEYDDAMETWGELADVIAISAESFKKLAYDYVKAVEKWFEKGVPSGISQEMIDAAGTLAETTYAATVATPKESLDPQGFTTYVSPVDSSNLRNVDMQSVSDNHARPVRFGKTASFINDLNIFSIHSGAALLMLRGDGDRTKLENQIRAQIVSLTRIAENLNSIENELTVTFGHSLLPDRFEESLVTLCCVLNTCLTKELRRERSVGYGQKLRARKLMSCRKEYSSRLAAIEGIDYVRETRKGPSFSVDLMTLKDDASFVSHSVDILSAMFGNLKDAANIVESMLLKDYLGEISIIYLMSGYYVGQSSLKGSQLVICAESGKEPFVAPDFETPGGDSSYTHVCYIDAFSIVQVIKLVAQTCLSVNNALFDIDSGLINVTNAYEIWRKTTDDSLGSLLDSLEPLLIELFEVLPDRGNEILGSMREVIMQAPSLAVDTTIIEYLDQLSNLVLEMVGISLFS